MNAKKKTLSFALACLMIIMTFSAAIPAFAETTFATLGEKDAAMVNDGYVCRIGDTLETAKYFKYLSMNDESMTGLNSDNKGSKYLETAVGQDKSDTIVLLTDITTVKASQSTGNSSKGMVQSYRNNITIDGNGHKYTCYAGFTAVQGKKITVKNLDIILTGAEVFGSANKGTITFQGCTFTAESGGHNDNGYFAFYNTSSMIKIIDSTFTINEQKVAAVTSNTIFKATTNNHSIVLNNFKMNIPSSLSAVNKLAVATECTVNLFDAGNALGYAAPSIVDGAAIRTADPEGLRFTANNAGTTANAYGFALAKYTEGFDANNVGNYKKVTIDAEDIAVDGTYMLSLVELPDITEKFAARAYAEYTVGDGIVTVYSAFDAENNVRSINQVADLIVEEAKAHTTADEVYKYEVGENMYSRYTKSQYDYIVENFATKENVTPG